MIGSPDNKSDRTAPWLLLGGMALFGSATPVSKIVGESFPPMLAGLARATIGGALLMLTTRSQWRAIPSIVLRDWLRIGAIALFGMFGFSAFMLYGMQRASGATGATVMSMTPAVTALGAILFFGERPSWRKLAALGLAIAGAAVLALTQGSAGGDARAPMLGAALVFAAVCCEAAYTLLGQQVSDRVDPGLVAGLGSVLSLPVFALAVAITEAWRAGSPDSDAWVALIWYGAGTLALGSWLWYRGIARVSGVTAAAFMGVMPLSALALSYILLHEPFRWVQLAGFGIVFAGVLLMSWEHARGAREAG